VPQIIFVVKGKTNLSQIFLCVYGFGVISWALFGLTMTEIHWPLVVISLVQLLFVLIILLFLRKKHEQK
jgi:uncharacterized protein with PQ loop repeat